jgi:hypothetical protein
VIRDQTDGGCRPPDWAVSEDEIGTDDEVVAIADTIIDPDAQSRTHCPVCGDRELMLRATTAQGERYDLCVGCGLLWHVDYAAGTVIGARQVAPPGRRRR